MSEYRTIITLFSQNKPSDFRIRIIFQFLDQILVGHFLSNPMQRVALIFHYRSNFSPRTTSRFEGSAPGSLRPHVTPVAVAKCAAAGTEDKFVSGRAR